MSDLINRKEAVEAIKNEMLSWLEGDSHDYRKVVDAIMDLPTVETEPVKHGHWIMVHDSLVACKCSVCGSEYFWYEDDINGYPYCAKCGARMDEEMEE